MLTIPCGTPHSMTRGAAIVLAGLLAAAAAHAQDVTSLRVRSLAATCASCHGTDGHAVDASAVPGLAGLPASALVDRLKAYKSGSVPSTVMQQIAKGYSDEQIEQLAAYFAAQKK
jgi:sulfide dehydrogenase cytochrome subunit